MHVVSVMNYKGGVGKTTLTANLAAEIAKSGLRVLMIDLDPQTNLTFSFYSVQEWNETIRDICTIRQWYEGDMPGQNIALEDLVLTPAAANAKLQDDRGRLDLISSHLGLIDIDMQLAAKLGGGIGMDDSRNKFLRLSGCLRAALRAPAFKDYDYVLIDCPPNFGLVTKTAIVASDHVLVPAKADYLSTLGIGYLRHSVDKLIGQYNECVDQSTSTSPPTERIDPQFAGVVFTMTKIYNNKAIVGQQARIDNVREVGDMPVFQASVRNGAHYFAEAGEDGIPPILKRPLDDISCELRAVTGEFVDAIAGGRHRS